jgi:hypothetical protein
MTQVTKRIQEHFEGLSADLRALEELAAQRRSDYHTISRKYDLSKLDPEAFDRFMAKPYLLRPMRGDRWELVMPRFVDFKAGWPVRVEGEYTVYAINRMIDLITPMPDWLRAEINLAQPEFSAHIEGDWLVVDKGKPNDVWASLGGGKRFSKREGKRLKMPETQRLQVIRDLLRKGVLPYRPQPIPAELRRNPADFTSIQLREKQARDFATWLEYSAVSAFATGGGGKTFFGIYAGASVSGHKAVVVPRRAIAQQWEARIKLLAPKMAHEWDFLTYQAMHKRVPNKKYSLVIYDEIQHMPANMGIKASQMNTATRIGLSATPWREDGNEDIIPALCGLPVGADWPSGEPADTKVWIVDGQKEKLDMVEQLVGEPTAGKTMIFVYRLDVGHTIAKRLGVPFVHGATAKQYKVIQDNDTFVISKVGDAGVSINATRVIEVDWLGGRAEIGQRALRTQHADERGEFHILMTRGEYNDSAKRLSALDALSFDVHVMGA